MGVYRRKDGEGKYFGPYIVQYPYRIDPITGKAVWTTCSVRGSKRLAKRVYQQKLIEWERKKHLKLEEKKRIHIWGTFEVVFRPPEGQEEEDLSARY